MVGLVLLVAFGDEDLVEELGCAEKRLSVSSIDDLDDGEGAIEIADELLLCVVGPSHIDQLNRLSLVQLVRRGVILYRRHRLHLHPLRQRINQLGLACSPLPHNVHHVSSSRSLLPEQSQDDERDNQCEDDDVLVLAEEGGGDCVLEDVGGVVDRAVDTSADGDVELVGGLGWDCLLCHYGVHEASLFYNV